MRVFNRHGVEKDERALQIEREEVERLARDRDDELAILDRNIYARLREMILGKVAVKGPKGVKANSQITEELLDEQLSRGQWWQLALEDEDDAKIVEALNEQYEIQKRALDARFEDKVEKVRRGDDSAAGCHEDGQGLRRGEAQAAAGRQDGRASRQQGRDLESGADGGHAVPGGWDPGRLLPQPAGRAEHG